MTATIATLEPVSSWWQTLGLGSVWGFGRDSGRSEPEKDFSFSPMAHLWH